MISSNQEKANMLCEYFSSVFNKDASRDDLFGTDKSINNMEIVNITTEDITSLLSDLSDYKSPGSDNVHPRVLKEVREVIALPLKIIFETSLNSGTLPIDWRSGIITSIFKKVQELK